MRLVIAVALVTLLGSPARAETDVLKVGSRGADCIVSRPGQPRVFRVHLSGHTDYALEQNSNYGRSNLLGDVSVQDASGNVLGRMDYCRGGPDNFDCGFEFRSSYNGDYFVKLILPRRAETGWCEIKVQLDCAASELTQCALPVGSVKANQLLNWGHDRDWFRTRLKGGGSYKVTLAGGATSEVGTQAATLSIRGPDGATLGSCDADTNINNAECSVSLSAPVTGRFFAEVAGPSQFYGRYTLRLEGP